MKKLLLLMVGLFFSQAHGFGYEIWVKNSTSRNLRVKIDSNPESGCPEPNHGNMSDPDPLAPRHEDSWGARSNCKLHVTITGPDASPLSVIADPGNHSFEIREYPKNGRIEFFASSY